MAHSLWEPESCNQQACAVPAADVALLHFIAFMITAFCLGVVAGEATRACRRVVASTGPACAIPDSPPGPCSREVPTESPCKDSLNGRDPAVSRGGQSGDEGPSQADPSEGSCDTDAAMRLDYADDSLGQTDAGSASSSTAAKVSSSAHPDKLAASQLGRPVAEVYRYDSVINITPSSLQKADPLIKLINQHVGGYHPGELDRLLRGAGNEEGQTLTVSDRKQLENYMHMFSRIAIHQDSRARETTQLCMAHIKSVLKHDRDAKILQNDIGRRQEEKVDRRARVLGDDAARVAVRSLAGALGCMQVTAWVDMCELQPCYWLVRSNRSICLCATLVQLAESCNMEHRTSVRILNRGSDRVQAMLVSAFQWALVEIGFTFLALLHEGMLHFWEKAPSISSWTPWSPWAWWHSSLDVVRYFGVPLGLLLCRIAGHVVDLY